MKIELEKEETMGIVELLLKLRNGEHQALGQVPAKGSALERNTRMLDKIESMTPKLKKAGYTNAEIVELLKSELFSRW